jgi:hypothetical protein
MDVSPLKNAESATKTLTATTIAGLAGVGAKVRVLDILMTTIPLRRPDQLQMELLRTQQRQT